jgi:hypothetical protein
MVTGDYFVLEDGEGKKEHVSAEELHRIRIH